MWILSDDGERAVNTDSGVALSIRQRAYNPEERGDFRLYAESVHSAETGYELMAFPNPEEARPALKHLIYQEIVAEREAR